MTKSVNFFCVGVQKAATSTLHDILLQHPKLGLPIYKETHFFSDDEKYHKGLDYYFKNNFKNLNKEFLAEIDPEYCYFSKAAERIKKVFPNTKIIFILRNPVERAYSQYLMTKRKGRENLSFEEAVFKEQSRLKDYFSKLHYSYIDRGRYTNQIERYQSFFDDENIKVFLFEDIIGNVEEVVKEICDFVGLPEYNFNYNIKSNVSSEPRIKFIRDFIFLPSTYKKLIGKLIPSKRLKDSIMLKLYQINSKDSEKEQISLELKENIYNSFYKEEISKLESLLDRDLSNWKY